MQIDKFGLIALSFCAVDEGNWLKAYNSLVVWAGPEKQKKIKNKQRTGLHFHWRMPNLMAFDLHIIELNSIIPWA